MKFLFEYRTAENQLCKGEIAAPNRDAVYVLLKARGVHPSRVVEAPGFLNKLFGKGKRWMAIVLLGSIVAYVVFRRVSEDVLAPSPLPRHYIDLTNIDLNKYLANPTDRFFAEYAIPGRLAASVLVPEELDLKTPVRVRASDPEPVRELKRVIAGMKSDARKHLSGTDGLARFLVWLEERQRMEAGYREDFESRVEAGFLSRDAANEMFEAMGLERLPDASDHASDK